VTVGLYDLVGRGLGTLEMMMHAGRGETVWTAEGADGAPLPTGVYLARALLPEGPVSIRLAYVK